MYRPFHDLRMSMVMVQRAQNLLAVVLPVEQASSSLVKVEIEGWDPDLG